MFDMMLVTHENIMTISGTHIQGQDNTQVHHYTQIDLLTCRVCFVKRIIITTQVLACAWSRSQSLSFFTALVCDLLPRRLFHGFARGALPEDHLSHNFDEHCLGGH